MRGNTTTSRHGETMRGGHSKKTTRGQTCIATRGTDGGATRGNTITSQCNEGTRGRQSERTMRGQDCGATRGQDSGTTQWQTRKDTTWLCIRLTVGKLYAPPPTPLPTLCSFSSPLLLLSAISLQFCFSWQPNIRSSTMSVTTLILCQIV